MSTETRGDPEFPLCPECKDHHTNVGCIRFPEFHRNGVLPEHATIEDIQRLVKIGRTTDEWLEPGDEVVEIWVFRRGRFLKLTNLATDRLWVQP